MPYPIVEKIAQNMFDTLRLISTANGYENDVTVERSKQHGNDLTDRKLVLAQDEASKTPEPPQAHVGWQQPFWIHCTVMESESSAVAIDTRINTIRADVEKVLRVDPTRGNLAVDTIIADPVLVGDETTDSVTGIVVQAVVQYRTLENDPYNQ